MQSNWASRSVADLFNLEVMCRLSFTEQRQSLIDYSPQYLSVFHCGTHHRQFQDQIHSLIQSWTVPAAHDCSYVWGPSSPVSHKQILLAGHLQSARRKLNYKVTGLQWASQMQGVTLVCFRQPDLKTHTESFHCDSYDKLQASVSRKPL